MFERRLKIILGVLIAMTAVLLLRAAQVQIVDHRYWVTQAAESMKRSVSIETSRGRILDVRGRPIAIDEPCIDVCVEYPAITHAPDKLWLAGKATERLRWRYGDTFATMPRKKRDALRSAEVQDVTADIDRMWARLGELSGQTPDQIEEVRRSITHKVEMRRRYIWYRHYEAALRKHEAQGPEPKWKSWLIDQASDAPEVDSFDVATGEQFAPHVVLRAIDSETQSDLGRHIERYPGLALTPGTHRRYPYEQVACHLVGHLSRVNPKDIEADPSVGIDELRQYYPNDLIGRTGLEALCEPALRGSRGRVERVAGSDTVVSAQEPAPGRDVRTTIDIELQRDLEALFAGFRFKAGDPEISMHGAAVVIDVATNEVRALASYPTYDPNRLDEQYAQLAADELNNPLLNRATQAQLEPGSIVKPIVGLGAITQGLIGVSDTVECTGYFMLNGRRQAGGARCWVASIWGKYLESQHMSVAHHPIPSEAPHPTGFLTFTDALERSCNVYFETVADRLGIDGVRYWFDRFGLGRPTGLGIAEASGRIPPRSLRARRPTAWYSGIGQGPVAATPIQMANVAATLARNGIWMRPRLAADADARPASRPSTGPATQPADRVDLKLSPEALRAALEGMVRVVNSPAGTGKTVQRADVLVAGKTGTPQAARFRVKLRDAAGRLVLDPQGKPMRVFLEPSNANYTNPIAPWYRGWGDDGHHLDHAWYIGFAPADHPQIAFVVLVEYGGSGGAVAGPIARGLLDSCIKHGYLKTRAPESPAPTAASASVPH